VTRIYVSFGSDIASRGVVEAVKAARPGPITFVHEMQDGTGHDKVGGQIHAFVKMVNALGFGPEDHFAVEGGPDWMRAEWKSGIANGLHHKVD
jgi:hypothetical protein